MKQTVFRTDENGPNLDVLPPHGELPRSGKTRFIGGKQYRVLQTVVKGDLTIIVVQPI